MKPPCEVVFYLTCFLFWVVTVQPIEALIIVASASHCVQSNCSPKKIKPENAAIAGLMCAEKTGGFNLVNYRHSSGVYHEQETEDLHRRI